MLEQIRCLVKSNLTYVKFLIFINRILIFFSSNAYVSTSYRLVKFNVASAKERFGNLMIRHAILVISNMDPTI